MEPIEKISECPLCGGRETWTGTSELREEGTYFEMRCEDCGTAGFEWRREWENGETNVK